MDSILLSIKKLLGLDEDYTAFDTDVLIHINSAFSVLTQLGVGPEAGFSIVDEEAVWTDFLDQSVKLEMVKTYIYLKVRQVFDQPGTAAGMESFASMVKEYEWRLNVAVDPEESEETE